MISAGSGQPKRWKAAFALICSAGAAFCLSSCSKSPSEAERIQYAVTRLQSGATAREIEQSSAQASAAIPDGFRRTTIDLTQDPHSTQKREVEPDLQNFYAGLRQEMSGYEVANKRFARFKKLTTADRPRSSFSDSELEALLAFAKDANNEARSSAERVSSYLDSRKEWITQQLESSGGDRLRLIEASRGGTDLIREFGRTEERNAPLFPFGFAALLPKPGQEDAALNHRSNPFVAAHQAWLSYFDSPDDLRPRFITYRELRDQDNPEPESVFLNGASASAGTTSVALIDTGIDFVKFKELGVFLGETRDYADDDRNAWLPAMGSFVHGTGTSATLLAMISRNDPELLESKRLQLRMWKIQTLRQLLSRFASDTGVARDDSSWENRSGIQDAVIEQVSIAGPDSPRVVITSLGFGIRDRIFKAGYESEFLSAPWVWVMAAGNSGIDPRLSSPSPCFLDLPEEYRPRDTLLCVGAAKMGENGPELQSYSNVGPDIDVYAPDAYSELCPSGTSCAAPAVGAAAAQLAARFPSLSAKALRTIIRRSAELHRTSGGTQFRYFDPATMMSRALKLARSSGLPETTEATDADNSFSASERLKSRAAR